MSTDMFREMFGPSEFAAPADAPCLPAQGATSKQIQYHADKWHPDHYVGHRDARRLCAGCPAKTACLIANLHEPEGIWGATTPDQRKKLRGQADVA